MSLLALASATLFLTALHADGNVHTVIPQELLRAGQPDAVRLRDIARRECLASVLNLRGPAPGAEWHDTEIAVSGQLGMVHADFPMSASREIGQHEAVRLVALMREMPKPLLIHCRHGSDRTGLAVALNLAAITGMGEEAAEAALSIRYGHFAVPYLSEAWPMDASFEKLEPWLGVHDS